MLYDVYYILCNIYYALFTVYYILYTKSLVQSRKRTGPISKDGGTNKS